MNISYPGYPAECLRIDEGQALASVGDLVTDEEIGADGFYANGTDLHGYNRDGYTGRHRAPEGRISRVWRALTGK
jgi:hypothetical protein